MCYSDHIFWFDRTIREIRRDMHKQREWRNELEKMKIGNVVGSLSVESKTLRASLVPITQRSLEQVKSGKPWHLHNACHIILALRPLSCCTPHLAMSALTLVSLASSRLLDESSHADTEAMLHPTLCSSVMKQLSC